MNLNQLRFANALANTASFTEAADQCYVTQPTLSNGIAQLENELGERLFLRTTRKVALTPFGVHLLPYVQEVLSAQEALMQQSRSFLTPDQRLIRLGTSPLLNAKLMRLMIEPFRELNPDIEIVLREMNMTDLQRMLDEGLLDFIFGVAHARKTSLTSAFLYAEPLLYLPRGGVWPNGSVPHAVHIKDISDQTYVMVPNSCGLSDTTRGLFRSQRRKLNEYSGEAMSYQVLQDWAALGIGSAILPKSKVSGHELGVTKIIDKSGQTMTIGFQASWSHENKLPHLLAFIHHLRNVVPAIASGLDPVM
jgi:LysR family transcriptional regulator, hydrogen peroxide-inducible genes activator